MTISISVIVSSAVTEVVEAASAAMLVTPLHLQANVEIIVVDDSAQYDISPCYATPSLSYLCTFCRPVAARSLEHIGSRRNRWCFYKSDCSLRCSSSIR